VIIIANSISISRFKGAPKRERIFRAQVKRGILSVLILGAILASTASASTPGCPDCPDWINFNDWWDKYHTDSSEADSGSSPSDIREQALKSRGLDDENLTANAEYAAPELLVSSRDDLKGRVLLDARSPSDYENGHLPGARNLYWKSVKPKGTLDPEVAVEELCRLGVNETDSIVVYGNGDDSAYLFWALEYLGQNDLARLDGNVEAISDLELVQNAPEPEKSNYTSVVRQGLLVNESMLEQAQGSLGVQIVDTRSSFSDYAVSRVSNSMHVKTADLYSDPEARTLKDAGELEKIFSGRGLDEEKVQMVYGTPEACTLYFALRTMGYKVTVLDGNWWQKTNYAVSSIS